MKRVLKGVWAFAHTSYGLDGNNVTQKPQKSQI